MWVRRQGYKYDNDAFDEMTKAQCKKTVLFVFMCVRKRERQMCDV